MLGDDVSANGLMFALMINYMTSAEALKYFSVSLTAFNIDTVYSVQMAACTADQWKLLGDNYQIIFDDYGLSDFLCPVSSDNLNLAGTFKKAKVKEIKLSINPCGITVVPGQTTNMTITDSNCKSVAEQQAYLNTTIANSRSLLAELYFLDQVVNSSAQSPVAYFVNNDNRISFTDKRGVDNTVEVGSFQITTDTSFLPWTVQEEITGNFVDKLLNSAYEISSFASTPYVTFEIIMNRRMVYVSRTIGKIDQTLSYVGGLFAIIISFLAFFMLSFNQYRYELMVA